MQREILEKYPAGTFEVYAVWFNMLQSDARSKWPRGLLSDPRVVEYWDDKKAVGTFFAAHSEYEKYPGEVLWDAYILFGPEARWAESPSHRVSWGFTIVQTRNQLKADLLRLIGAPPPPGIGPAGSSIDAHMRSGGSHD